jgi:hypothetical protein
MQECTENWADIPGYVDFYQASSLGRIRSVDCIRTVIRGWKISSKKVKGEIISQTQRGPYLSTILRDKEGQPKTHQVHRLVAMAFLKPAHKGQIQVNHIDGNKLNNYIDNLEWCTPSENVQHAIYTGLTKVKNPENYPAVLDPKKWREIYGM